MSGSGETLQRPRPLSLPSISLTHSKRPLGPGLLTRRLPVSQSLTGATVPT